ncbi:MAG: N-acetylornithine carbamoyltransferase [Phycisphaerae bacterium]|nr:N-acetylornithine carbamoyltransferase [Phycisphaerae bacterium]
MRKFISFLDHEPADLLALAHFALAVKQRRDEPARTALHRRILGMVFFNPSLRTRMSFEAAMLRFGGAAITLNVGGDAWNLEYRDGVIMNGDRAEHVREAAPVISRYCDILGVRTFASLASAEDDARDTMMRAFSTYATVPVVSMESALEHPCQGLADMLTLEEKLGGAAKRKFVLTWAPQARPVPMAVPHSAILAAAAAGMNVTVAHPPGYDLNAEIVDRARSWCAASNCEFRITHDQRTACREADAVYVKSWGAARLYRDVPAQLDDFKRYADWMVTLAHLQPHPSASGKSKPILMHCLPVRRNVVIADHALDDPGCVVVDQAENRLWAEVAVLTRLLGAGA